MKRNFTKKLTSFILLFLMIAALVPIIAINASAAEGYIKATSIAVGDTVVIACENAEKELTSFSTSSTVYGIGEAYKSVPTGTMTWTVGDGASEGTYSFKSADGNYLCWKSGNSAKTQSDLNANSSWKIEFDSNGNAIFSNASDTNRNLIWNNSSPRFACYTGKINNGSIANNYYHIQLWKYVESTTDPDCTHESEKLTEHLATEAKCTEAGNSAYWTCDCGKFYSDATATTEIEADSWIIPATGHMWDENGTTCTVCQTTRSFYNKLDDITSLKDGDGIVIYYPKDKLLISSTATADSKLTGVAATLDGTTLEVIGGTELFLIAHKDENGDFYFETADGKYLTTGETGGSLTLESTLGDYAKWYFDTTGSTAKLRIYNCQALDYSKIQALEYYNNAFTTYNTADTAFYAFEIYKCAHTVTTPVEGQDANCAEGTNGYTAHETCDKCGEVIGKETIYPVHNDGNQDGRCDGCGKTMCVEHDWTGEEKILTPATCTTVGEKEQTCKACGDKRTVEISAPGHTEVTDPAVEVTCTTDGKTEGSRCSVCDEVLVAQTVIPTNGHTYSNGKCTVCGEREPIYTLVTDASTLMPGDKIIIVAKESDFALSTNQTSNNRPHTEIVRNGNIIVPGADVQILTLEAGTKDGTFAFYTGLGYLYAASSSSNHLKTQYTLDDNGSWTITIADGIATITAQGDNSHNLLQYNETSKLFSAYVKDQKDIAIYKYNDPTIDSMNVVLNKGVTVNVKIHITAEWLALNPGAQIKFNCGENSKVYDLKAGDNVYSVQLTPAQINDVLTAEVINGNGDVVISKDVSIDTYKTKIESSTYTDLGISEAKYIALVKLLEATVNYSKVARGETVALTVPEYFTAAGNDFSVSDTNTVFLGFSGKLSTYASIYVTLQTGVSAEAPLSVKRGETALVPENSVIGTYINENDQIVLSGLYALNFDDEHVISSAESSVTFSMNSYLKAVYNAGSSTESVKNMAVATYLYGVAAEAFNSAK